LPVGGRRVNAIEDLASVPHIMCGIAQERTLVSADAIAGVLGGIGRRRAVSRDFALTEAVRAGLPIAALDRLIANGVIAEHEVETHFIPRRTLYARRQKGTFSREQSDLIVRLARIQAMADDVLGERPKSHSWLRRQNGALDGEIPLALLDTEEGGRLVEAVLGRIAHGIVE
jgi:putative toxin-antitoxin system antitoxin component (TIGR02293 family)